MKMTPLHWLYGSALLLLTWGLILSATTARQAAGRAGQLQQRLAVLSELHTMRAQQQRGAAVRQAFAALPNAVPPSLASLAADTIPATAAPDIREIETRPLAQGWVLTRTEVTFNEVSLDQLPAFWQAAEAQRPPWRLRECTLTASTRADGVGRALLVVEAIGRPRP